MNYLENMLRIPDILPGPGEGRGVGGDGSVPGVK